MRKKKLKRERDTERERGENKEKYILTRNASNF